MDAIRIFISYSWESETHNEWVKRLADRLEEHAELHVVWDGYDLDSLRDKNLFMESAVRDADFVIVVSTLAYKRKADERAGGVGIETYLSTAAHWRQLLKEGKTKFLPLLREKDAIPTYLEGQFWIDFENDSIFEVQFSRLLDHIHGRSKHPRPPKRSTLAKREVSFNFTKAKDLIKIAHPNRREIVSLAEGTDFSDGNRVKFEIWETKRPAISYFVAFHPNITISQTAQRAADRLVAMGIRSSEITVLRHRPPRPEQDLVKDTFNRGGIDVYECTYKEYIWDYCIDDSLKAIAPPSVIDAYTSQSLVYTDLKSGELTRNEAADEFVVKLLQESSSSAAAHLIVAPGGMGKTSLCLSVANQLHELSAQKSSVILIQAEVLKGLIVNGVTVQGRIESIYDLYELYAKHQAHSRIYDRNVFEMAVICGNLAIVIDGLDELSSILQEKFDVVSFLQSLKDLYDQLGNSHILLTTRNHVVADAGDLEKLSIKQYQLLGFDQETCKRYIRRRLHGLGGETNRIVDKVMTQIGSIGVSESDDRIIPFFADVVATVAEDAVRSGSNDEFDLSSERTPYPSNNELTDHIIHSVFRREERRHHLGISIAEAVDNICEFVAEYKQKWPVQNMRERIAMYYDARAQEIFPKVMKNPLLVINGDEVELRYSFLSAYFTTLFILKGVANSSATSELSIALARLGPASEEIKDVRKYFSANRDLIAEPLANLIHSLRDRAISKENTLSVRDIESAKSAMAILVGIYGSLYKGSIAAVTDNTLRLYGVARKEGDRPVVKGLALSDDFPPFDFSGLIVSGGMFRNYSNFLASKFNKDTSFIYSTFEGCANPKITNTALRREMIDSTCAYGNLNEALSLARESDLDAKSLLESEAEKFLRSFYRGDRFEEKRRDYVRFSTRVPGLSPDKFDRLVANDYITIAKEKTIGTFYEVASHFQASVRRFLANGYVDGKLRQFFEFIK